jgi:hypothetical protein
MIEQFRTLTEIVLAEILALDHGALQDERMDEKDRTMAPSMIITRWARVSARYSNTSSLRPPISPPLLFNDCNDGDPIATPD